ncbi:hypothetical protein QR680_015645 [Steinernema hermaphroditum]|uniref:Uncharacterized protein n=1 Tax=Steinernema hermaphroditum TaxID=289476 RepID=A0AA39LL99_9BILA|nr:hypothetical protein QR680_015645 [Steinernema hermaphroditum]
MFAVVVFILLAASAHGQDATSLAQYIYNNVGNFFQVSELVKLENAILQQACGGATVQQIFDNFDQTVSQSIGGATAANMLGLVQKLKNDLGNDFDPVRNAASNAGQQAFNAAFSDVTQYCSSGNDAVFAEANNYANQQFTKSVFDQIYQAVSGVNPNDWTICRNDLANYIYFSTYGY